jgi:hypothetical protein
MPWKSEELVNCKRRQTVARHPQQTGRKLQTKEVRTNKGKSYLRVKMKTPTEEMKPERKELKGN